MNEHIVKSYEDELNALSAECVRMGGLAEAQVADAVNSVVKRNQDLASAVVARDDKLDEAEREIERRTIRLIALRQPVADDLRRGLAAMSVAGKLEDWGALAQ